MSSLTELAVIGADLVEIAQALAELKQLCSTSAPTWPKLVQMLPKSGKHIVDIGPTWAALATHTCSNAAPLCSTAAKLTQQDEFGRPTTAQCVQGLARHMFHRRLRISVLRKVWRQRSALIIAPIRCRLHYARTPRAHG